MIRITEINRNHLWEKCIWHVCQCLWPIQQMSSIFLHSCQDKCVKMQQNTRQIFSQIYKHILCWKGGRLYMFNHLLAARLKNKSYSTHFLATCTICCNIRAGVTGVALLLVWLLFLAVCLNFKLHYISTATVGVWRPKPSRTTSGAWRCCGVNINQVWLHRVC